MMHAIYHKLHPTPHDSVQHRARSCSAKRSGDGLGTSAYALHVVDFHHNCSMHMWKDYSLQVTNRRSGIPRCVMAMRALHPFSVKTQSQRQWIAKTKNMEISQIVRSPKQEAYQTNPQLAHVFSCLSSVQSSPRLDASGLKNYYSARSRLYMPPCHHSWSSHLKLRTE